MITKEEFERFKKFYAHLRLLVLEKLKEKYEIEHGKPFPKDEHIKRIEYDIEDDCFSIEAEFYGRYQCHDTDYYSLEPKYLYNEDAMKEYKEKIDYERSLKFLDKINKERIEKELHENAEKDGLFDIAKKHGYSLVKIKECK